MSFGFRNSNSDTQRDFPPMERDDLIAWSEELIDTDLTSGGMAAWISMMLLEQECQEGPHT